MAGPALTSVSLHPVPPLRDIATHEGRAGPGAASPVFHHIPPSQKFLLTKGLGAGDLFLFRLCYFGGHGDKIYRRVVCNHV